MFLVQPLLREGKGEVAYEFVCSFLENNVTRKFGFSLLLLLTRQPKRMSVVILLLSRVRGDSLMSNFALHQQTPKSVFEKTWQMHLFYKIRAKRESEIQHFLGVWSVAAYLKFSFRPHEKLKTGLFAVFFL